MRKSLVPASVAVTRYSGRHRTVFAIIPEACRACSFEHVFSAR